MPPDDRNCEIRVEGHLAPRWAASFDGMTLTHCDDGTTVIAGTVADQSAVDGLLRTSSGLGLVLVSVVLTGTTTHPTTAPIRRSTP
ncbi:MAG TPA: hypothetical protein VGN18_06570 [Jatrophihabitans sp.]|uniref:hypothetical protein n=1 Tax=Jatrophihabitans sp. TaxID=1932789 RepID=UPI002DFE9772|nr:hypothetical protein [Jatrophihabitans sp.]